jgi:hypothetical protein
MPVRWKDKLAGYERVFQKVGCSEAAGHRFPAPNGLAIRSGLRRRRHHQSLASTHMGALTGEHDPAFNAEPFIAPG